MRKSIKKRSTKKRRATPRKTMSKGRVPVTVQNPFGTASVNPKIPDGLTPFSCGQRLQQSREIVQGAADFVLVLYPGIEGGLYVYNDFAKGFDPDACTEYGKHVQLNDAGEQVDASRVVQWRVVSQALRLSLNNNCEESDGWFEAIRIDTVADSTSSNWEVVGGVPVAKGRLKKLATAAFVAFGQNQFYWAGANTNTNFIESHSYVTGKLKDIHKYIFQLRPMVREHSFTKLSPTNSADSYVDGNFDTIVIKIHGKFPDLQLPAPPPGTPPTNASRFTAHWICNQEVVYDENSNLSRYHSECKYSESAMQAMKTTNVSRGMKAGYITKRKY